jgi:hypothetical protein
MMRADEFDQTIRAGKKKGESMGRTKLISAALGAYWESRDKQQADAEQAAYLYQVIKLCNWWIKGRTRTTSSSTTEATRRFIIEKLLEEANQQLILYPIIYETLLRYNKNKALGARPATPLKGVYAHEGTAYQEAKAQGQFYDPHLDMKQVKKYAAPSNLPHADRYAPSATKMEGKNLNFKNDPISQTPFRQLSFNDYMHLDELLGRQYTVLYLSKFQRLQYMVPVDFGVFWRSLASKNYDMPGSRVTDDILAPATAYMFACDRYGNLFVVKNDMKDTSGNYIQINHSTLVSGRDVLCAGTISIKGGKLKGVSNSSGHYTPSTQELTNFLKLLQTDGGVTLDASVVVIDKAGGIYTTADRFLLADFKDLAKTQAVQNLLNRTA